jgi:hypothetical protein
VHKQGLSYPLMATSGRDCVRTWNKRKTGGTETLPHMPIATVWPSGEADFHWACLQSEVSYSLDRKHEY